MGKEQLLTVEQALELLDQVRIRMYEAERNGFIVNTLIMEDLIDEMKEEIKNYETGKS